MAGIQAVQAFRASRATRRSSSTLVGRYRDANVDSFRLVAIFVPGVRLIGNLTIGVVLLYGGYRVIEGDMTVGVLAAFLLYLRLFFEPMQEISPVLQPLPVGQRRRWRSCPACWRRSRRWPSRRARSRCRPPAAS